MTTSTWVAWGLQRSIRLILPVLATLLLSALLYRLFYAGHWSGEGSWLVQYLWQKPPTATSVIEQGLLVRSAYNYEMDNVLWTLAHEWRISLLLPILVVGVFRRRTSAPLILFIGIAAAGLAGGAHGAGQNLNPGLLGSIESSIYFVLPFAIGAAMERANVLQTSADRLTIIFAYVAVMALARMNDDITDYLASAILIWLAVQPGLLRQLLNGPVLQWLGKVSFSLYLVHELVIATLQHQLHGAFDPQVIFVISCLAALPAAYLFFVLVERPVHRLARAVWLRSKPVWRSDERIAVASKS